MVEQLSTDQFQEYSVLTTVVYYRQPSDATGVVALIPAGQHGKCRIQSVTATYVAYSTAGDIFVIEDGDGNDAASCDMTSSPAVGKKFSGTLTAGQIFDRYEAINANLTTDGNAANAFIATIILENIH